MGSGASSKHSVNLGEGENAAASVAKVLETSGSLYDAIKNADPKALKELCDAAEKASVTVTKLKAQLVASQSLTTDSHGTYTEVETKGKESESKKNADDHGEAHLPPELREFVPFNKQDRISATFDGLKELEAAFQSSPSSPEAATQLKAKLADVGAAYKIAIAEHKCKDGIVSTCDTVILVGNQDFEQVYTAVWGTIESSEPEAIAQCKESLKLLQRKIDGAAEQRTSDPVELYRDAAHAKVIYDPFVNHLAESHGHATLMCPDSLKKTSRIMEKSLLRHDKPGHCERVCDIVRAMVVFSSMLDISRFLEMFASTAGAAIVRIKDRFFSAPSSGGWRDIMINFYMVEDASKHVCEMQLVHKTMLTARKGLPGHVIYGRVRNAFEILESLQFLPHERMETAQRLRSEGTLADELLRLGCKIDVVVAAGYELKPLRALGFSDETLKEAGTPASQFHAVGVPLMQLRNLGFSGTECEALGYGAQQLLSVGFAVKDLKNKGAWNVAVGVLLMDFCRYDGDTPSGMSPELFSYPSFFEPVPGLTWEIASSGFVPPQIEKCLEGVVERFKEQGVSMVTAEIGAMISLGPILRNLIDKPLVLSPLSLLPSVASAFGTNSGSGLLAVITMNPPEVLSSLVHTVGEETGCMMDLSKLVTIGCEDVPGFEALAMGEPLDVPRVKPYFVGYVKEMLGRQGTVRAVLMEDPGLCPFSDAIRVETGLPVFDVITACDFTVMLQQPRQNANN